MIDEGRRIAAAIQQEARTQSRQEAEAILRQAREEIDRELRRGLDDLRGTVADLSLRIAQDVIGEQMDEQKHKAMVDEFIQRVQAEHGQPGQSSGH